MAQNALSAKAAAGIWPNLMRSLAACLALLGLSASPAMARAPLGMFGSWGSFRDTQPLRCFAIATPVEPGTGKWRGFAAICHWPDKAIRGQVHFRLSRQRQAGADVMLSVGDRRWRLMAGEYDAWGPSPRHDAFIVAKIRAARSMSISTVDVNGRPFADSYRLQGAATAIDAAALGCIRR